VGGSPDYLGFRVNNDSGAGVYSSMGMEFGSLAVSSVNYPSQNVVIYTSQSATSATYATGFAIDLFDYTNANYAKSGLLVFSNNLNTANNQSTLGLGGWSYTNTGPITSMQSTGATFKDTQVTLYGIKREP
jgi:hypothetical protein